MSRISKTISQLYQGVSQQSPVLRLDGQCESSDNTLLTIPRGLEKRPASRLIANSESSLLSREGYFHAYNRDETEQYLMYFNDNEEIFVIDKSGLTASVIYEPNTQQYLSTTNPQKDLRAVTVGDTTFISNALIQPQWDESIVSPEQDTWATVTVLQSTQEDTEKNITLTLVDSNGDLGTATKIISIEQDALTVCTDYVTQINALPDYSCERLESTSSLRITRTGGGDFKVSVGDALGGVAQEFFKSTGGSRSDLPGLSLDGDVARISLEEGNEFDYYLVFNGSRAIWEETLEPGIVNTLDATTMPHQLVRTALNEFTLKPIEWTEQGVGDIDSVPDPSFLVGDNTIVNIFFHKDRLGFLLKQGVVLSRTSDYFNFFPNSVIDTVGDDPVDVTVSSNKVVSLHFALPFPESLVLFGAEQQFDLHTGDRAFTPANVIIDETTSKTIHRNFSPQKINASIYFTSPNEGFSMMHEYAVITDTNIGQASEVTGHVSRYIPNNLKQMIVSESTNMIFLVPENSKELYVYTFFYQGNSLVQSCWNKWTFYENILGGSVFDGTLYLLMSKQDGNVAEYNLVSLDLENTQEDFHLDRVEEVSNVTENISEFHSHDFVDGDFIQYMREIVVEIPYVEEFLERDEDIVYYDDVTKEYFTMDSYTTDNVTAWLVFKDPTLLPNSDTIETMQDSIYLGMGNYPLGGLQDEY